MSLLDLEPCLDPCMLPMLVSQSQLQFYTVIFLLGEFVVEMILHVFYKGR